MRRGLIDFSITIYLKWSTDFDNTGALGPGAWGPGGHGRQGDVQCKHGGLGAWRA